MDSEKSLGQIAREAHIINDFLDREKRWAAVASAVVAAHEERKAKAGEIACPLCQEKDFDQIGLKMHFLNRWCEGFNNA